MQEHSSRNVLQLCLTDMPDAWLRLLPEALDHESRLAAFQTCPLMRDLVMGVCRVGLEFTLPLKLAQATAAGIALSRACRQCPSTRLVLSRAGGDEEENIHDVAASVNASACSLMLGAMETPGTSLTAIQSVQLQGLLLDSVVTHWLQILCPGLATLTLNNCQFSALPAHTVSVPTHKQLRELHVVGLSYDNTEQPAFDSWQHQLRALPGLQHLSLNTSDDWQHEAERWLENCAVVGAQLTYLEYHWGHVEHLPAQVATWYPNLCTLYLPNLSVQDDGMEALLSLPTLKRLEVHDFDLQHGYTHRPCTWTHLQFGVLAVDQFTRLPLEGLLLEPASRAGVVSYAFTIVPSSDPEATSSVVAAIAKCGGIRWGDMEEVCLDLDLITDFNGMALLPALLAGCPAANLIVRRADHMDRDLSMALQPFFTCLPLTMVTLSRCGWLLLEDCALVLPSLPAHIHIVRLEPDPGAFGEDNLLAMCMAACNLVEVRVWGDLSEWEDGWEERVLQAMTAAGHSVTMEVTDGGWGHTLNIS